MRGRALVGAMAALAFSLCVVATGSLAGPSTPSGGLKAGAAAVDATWHVGASAGQYASDGTPLYDHGNGYAVDPSLHSTKRAPTYGIQSRDSVRALVVESAGGQRVAIVTNSMYIPQDLVNSRTAAILEQRDFDISSGLIKGTPTGIHEDNLVVSASHSHSSPYYSSIAAGAWSFQDVFDVRFFEFLAQRMAEAVVRASDTIVPVRMGGATSSFDKLQRNSMGPSVGNDGTPSGYPHTDNDKTVEVVAFDDMTDPAAPRPLATWVVFGLHPEMLEGNNLHSGEYVNAMERIVDREVGGVTLFTQNNTGSSEADDSRAHAPADRAEYYHRDYAQMERAAALLADAVEDTRLDILHATPERPDQWVPFTSNAPVGVVSVRLAPPGRRVEPTVGNCRTERDFELNPGIPGAGLPDCLYPLEEAGLADAAEELPFDPRVTYDTLRDAGIPVPDNIGAPSIGVLQENLQVHLMALKLGDIGVTVCPCEQWSDQSKNIQSRLDRTPNNLWLGYDWAAQTTPAGRAWCVPADGGMVTCADPRSKGTTDLAPVPEIAYRRMIAQVRNDARGWDDLANALTAESEPVDPAAVLGNYTHEELTPYGYGMVITAGMSNDYLGYIATYREYQRGDHYRKALTGLGPHSSDYFATRLSRLAASLNGWSGTVVGPKDVLYSPERLRQRATADLVGRVAQVAVPIYEATLPADGGTPGITAQPAAITRFSAAKIGWVGGSNWFDLPNVRVERLQEALGTWNPYGDQHGEVQTRVYFPLVEEMPDYLAGGHAWKWEATFEAFDSDVALPDLTGMRHVQTPAGTYRFVIDGTRHTGTGSREPYHLESSPFTVSAWDGLQPRDLRVDAGRTVSFAVPNPAYPDSYDSPFPFIRNAHEIRQFGEGITDDEAFCFRCSFRPWADHGTVSGAQVTVVRAGQTLTLVATLSGDGRWHTPALRGGDVVTVQPGDVVDGFGERNATPLGPVTVP